MFAVLIAGYSLIQIAVAVVVIAAVCALVAIALRQFGIALPSWVTQALWVIAIAIVIIMAIRLVGSM